jgi:hypothetical protein
LKKKYVILIIYQLLFILSKGQESITIPSIFDEIYVTENQLSVLSGKDDWNIDDVNANQDLFVSAKISNPLKSGTSSKKIWLKFVITENNQYHFLQFSHTNLEKLKFYFFVDGKDSVIEKDMSLKKRININYKLSYPTVLIPKGNVIRCFVEYNPGGNTSASDIIIVHQEQLFKSESTKSIYYGIYFGIMLLAFVIYVVVFSITRNISNIFFGLYIITFLMYIAINSGIYYLYLPDWGKYILSSKWAPAIWVNFSCLFICAFARRYIFKNVSLKSVYISPHIIIALLLLLLVPFNNLQLFHTLSHINMIAAFLSVFYCFQFKSPFLYKPSKRILYLGNFVFSVMAFFTVLSYEGFIYLPSTLNSRLLEIGSLIESVFTAFGYFILYLKEQSDVNKQLIKEQDRIIKLRVDENIFKRERVKNLTDKKERAVQNLAAITTELDKINQDIIENENAILVSSKAQGKVSKQIAETNFISKDILNSVAYMIVIVDENITVLDYNDKFEKMNKLMGIHITKGKNLISQISPIYRTHYEKHYKLAFARNTPITKPVYFKNAILTEGYWLSITYKVFKPNPDSDKHHCIAFAKHLEMKRGA